MESTVPLKIEVTVEPGTKVYKFDEKMSFIDELTPEEAMEAYSKEKLKIFNKK